MTGEDFSAAGSSLEGQDGRCNVLSSRGRAPAESRRGASIASRRVNPVSDLDGHQSRAASVPSRIVKKREADETLDGEERPEEAAEKERPLAAPQENHIQKNHIPPGRREVYEPPRREPFANMPNSDDEDWATEPSTELRRTEIVTVDFDRELDITWAVETTPPTFRSVADIIRDRDPHRFEEAIMSDRHKQLRDILMQKDLNGSNVLHQICAAPCDSQTHFADDLIALILRTVRSRRTMLCENNPLGLTPLHLAVKNGSMCLVKTLLKHRAPLTATDLNGCMPIHLAYENNHAKMVDTLLLAGSNYEQIFCNERRAPRKRRAFAQLQKHALKMDSLLQMSRQKACACLEVVEAISPVFTLQSGEKEGQFDFRYRAKDLDGNHAYMVFFFICDIQKENRDEWTARCWNSPSAFSLRFKHGFPQFNGGPMYPAQLNPDPLSYYCIFGKTEDNRISVCLLERCPLLVCCQVVLVKGL